MTPTPEAHFDRIAKEYDYWKDKNRYYYDHLKVLLQEKIPQNASVVEIGCGTGDLLASVAPCTGKGIDISEEMVEIAKRRHAKNPNLSFARVDLLNDQVSFDEDYVFTCDVLEHVRELPEFLERLQRAMKPGSKLVVTLANPFWEPLLMLTEKLGMKMPEGPHWRLSIQKNEELYRKAGLEQTERGYRLLVPKKTAFSDSVNQNFYKNSLLRPFGFIVYWVLKKPL
jgi:ubiquinone/menaquinone biosynthesis C-methylase UbiE